MFCNFIMNKYCKFCDKENLKVKSIFVLSNFINMYYICNSCYKTLIHLYFTHCTVCGKKLLKHPNDSSKIISLNSFWILSEIHLIKFIIYYTQINCNNENIVLKYRNYLANLKKLYVCINCYKNQKHYIKTYLEFNKIQPFEENINISNLYYSNLKTLLYRSYESNELSGNNISPKILKTLRSRLINEIKEHNN